MHSLIAKQWQQVELHFKMKLTFNCVYFSYVKVFIQMYNVYIRINKILRQTVWPWGGIFILDLLVLIDW